MFEIRDFLRSFVLLYEPTMDSVSWSKYFFVVAVVAIGFIAAHVTSDRIRTWTSLSPETRNRTEFLLRSIGTIPLVLLILDILIRYVDDFILSIYQRNFLYIHDLYVIVDDILQPHTSYFLYFFPLYVIIFGAISNISLNKYVGFIVGVWMSISALFLLRYLLATFFLNPLSIVLVIVVIFWVTMFNSTSLEKNYARWTPLGGFTLRLRQKEDNKRDTLGRQGAMVGIASAFFLNLTVSSGVQISYYMALLSGLLAIIGFLALIFTFTFEMMKSHGARRSIAADTKRAQSAMMVLIGFSILGVFISDAPVTFDLRAVDSGNIVSLAIFSFCVVGGAASIDFTMDFFHRIVDFSTDNNLASSTGLSFAFAEMNTVGVCSSISSTREGLATMRAHLEEKGDRVLTIEKTDAVSLRRLGKTVIVIPRISRPISKADAAFYLNFVKRGNGMIILLDKADAEYKKELLSAVGIETSQLAKGMDTGQTIFLDLHKDFEIEDIGEFRPVLRNPVFLRFMPEIIAEHKEDSLNLTAENNSLIFREIEKGLVVVVGSIDHWSNQHIIEEGSLLFLDYIHTLFLNAIGTRNNP